jgi:hypothetical protein
MAQYPLRLRRDLTIWQTRKASSFVEVGRWGIGMNLMA